MLLVETISTVKENFDGYELLKAVGTEAHVVELCKDLRLSCAAGGFKLIKWLSNKRAVLAFIPESERAKDRTSLHLNTEDLPVGRALGEQ